MATVIIIPKNTKINFLKHHNILFRKGTTLLNAILCGSVCTFGRFAVWPLIISTNIVYLTTNEFRKPSKTKNALQITGWILIGLMLANVLIWSNWGILVRSIPAYVILILLQLDLYSENDEPTKKK